jgi:hypothetical protein
MISLILLSYEGAMADLFSGAETYTALEDKIPGSEISSGVVYNGDGSASVTFEATGPDDGQSHYDVSFTDAGGDVKVQEIFDSGENDYTGSYTNYSNGGDFLVYITKEDGNFVSPYYMLLLSAPTMAGETITLYNDSRSGTFVPPVCYVEGARILTVNGETAVEALRVGDLVVTATGEQRPIRWLGHRTVDCSRHPDPRSVWPVRVCAHAFGQNRPCRDLYVSPGHGLCVTCVDEVLIPAVKLVNGSTVSQQRVDRVTYWHVELDDHDILIANGMPAESYLEMGNRRFFIEGHTVDLRALPDGSALTHDDFCRPFIESGPLVEVARERLAARAQGLGWTRESSFECHVLVDGRKLEPTRSDGVLTFRLPSSARQVRLTADTFTPNDVDGRGDRRDLGLCLRQLTIESGAEQRIVTPDDARLDVGFHPVERCGAECWRWTSGEAALPPTLWEDLGGELEINIAFESRSVRGWNRPVQASDSLLPQQMAG